VQASVSGAFDRTGEVLRRRGANGRLDVVRRAGAKLEPAAAARTEDDQVKARKLGLVAGASSLTSGARAGLPKYLQC